MSKEIDCFWLAPVDQAERYLRRFVFNVKCTGPIGIHDAENFIGRVRHQAGKVIMPQTWPHTDARWPLKCACGYMFTDADEWQVNIEPLYKRSDTGEMVTLRNAPVGAMWDAWWMHRKGPDGRYVILRTPGGDWAIDGPSNNGNGWTREGGVPQLTAQPSIVAGKYHGWLRGGKLVEC